MIRPKRVRVKEVFKDGNWIITLIKDLDRKYLIEAKRQYPIKNQLNFFSGEIGREYANNLALEYYGVKITEILE